MKITKVCPHLKGIAALKITFEDTTELVVPQRYCPDIYEGQEIDCELVLRLVYLDSLKKAMEKTLNILDLRQYSKKEVEFKLVRKGFDANVAEEATLWAQGQGFIDDKSYAESIKECYLKKGYGEYGIKNEMIKRGIDREIISDVLEETEISADAIISFLSKKLKSKNPEQKEIKRAMDALIRRGHSYEDIKSALRRYLEEV